MATEAFHEAWMDPSCALSAEEAEEYDPIAVARDRSEYIADFLRLLVTGRDSDNAELRGATSLRLRKTYIKLLRDYRSSVERHGLGFHVPEWESLNDVPMLEERREVAKWTVEEWWRSESAGIRRRASLHASYVARAFDRRGTTRAEKKQLNVVMNLLVREVGDLEWVLELGS